MAQVNTNIIGTFSTEMIGIFNEISHSSEISLLPVILLKDFNQGEVLGIPFCGKLYYKHWDDIASLTINYSQIPDAELSYIKSLHQGDVMRFYAKVNIVRTVEEFSGCSHVCYSSKISEICNITKDNTPGAIEKIIQLTMTKLKKYSVISSDKEIEHLIASNIKDILLVGSSPNTTGVYLASLFYQEDDTFYVSDIKKLTGWNEADIQRGLNELSELGYISEDLVADRICGECLPPYCYRNYKQQSEEIDTYRLLQGCN